MGEEEVTMGNEDQLFRRSSRKRRKINYKSNEKQLRVIVPSAIKNDGKPKKRGRPRKKPICDVDAVQKPQNHDKAVARNCKAFRLDEIDHMIEEFIKLGDKNAIVRVINTLQHALQETSKKSDDITVGTDNSIEIIKEVPPSVRSVSFQPSDPAKNISTAENVENSRPSNFNPVLQTASSIPANLQTKSISVHGNSIIMQGVIDTGMAQTSCFLIPIDINNIARFPGGLQLLGNQPPQVIGPQHHVLNTPSNSPMIIPVNPPQSSFVSANYQPGSISNNMNNVNDTPVTISSATSGGSTNSLISLDSNKTHNTNKGLKITSNTNNVASSSVSVNEVADIVSTSKIIETGIISQESSAPEKSGNKDTASNADSHTAAPVESILEALQSTDSLAQILDQLSHEEMVSIVNILTNNSQATQHANSSSASTSDSLASDLVRIASDIDKISKLDAEQLSSGVVNNLATEISKVLSSAVVGTGGAVLEGQDKLLTKLLDSASQEEDEDFQHAQIPQIRGEDGNGRLKCYMCGLVCTDEKDFMAHMRFHLFNYRYSCYECGYGTSSMNELLLHKAKEHEGDLTKISPDFLKQLPKSERTSSPDLEETLIQCPECKADIPLNSLGSHMTQKHKPLHRASPGRKPKCTICTALVENKVELAAHVKHHGRSDDCFACYFCTLNYSTISSLQLHTTNYHATLAARRHYKCTQCSREFSGSYHLIRHVKTVHEQRRDYQCSKCDKSFVELHCLRRHIRNIHNLIRDHTCPVCNRGFTYRQDMFRHIMSVHQKIRDIKCPLCSEKFYHRYFIGHAYRQHDLKVKYRDGICYIYDDAGNVIHKIT